MRSVLKLVSANIRHKKGAFKGIVFLMMLIVFSFTGTVSNKDDLDISINESFDKVNCGDLVIRIYSDLVSGKINDTINDHPGISHTEYRDWLFVMQKPLVDGEEKEILIELSPYTVNTMVFNDDFTAFVTEDPAPKQGEIYLPYKMKTLIDKGSEIKIRTSDNTEYVFTVKGYYEDPMYGPIAVSSNCCVISAEDLESIKASSDHITDSAKRILPCTDIHIFTEASPYELKKQLNDECDIIDMCISSASKDELIDNTRIFSDVGSRMVLVYMILLVSIIMIIMNNSISSSIEMDYTDLGILRSQGFTQTQIRMSFVLQYTLALVIGAVIGLVLSIPGCGALIRLFMNMTGMLTKTDISLGKCLLLSIGIILLCVIFIFLATAKIGKISPVRAISGGRDEVYFDGSINMPVRKKGLSLLLALRQITSDIKNYIGIAVMMAILIFFLVTTTSFVGGFDPDNIFSGMTGDIKINSLGDLSLSDRQKIDDALCKTDSGAYLSMETSHRMDVDGQQIDVRSYIRDEDQFSPIQGRAPQYDNEIMITKSVSRSTGKAIGDTLHIKYTDHSGDYIITGYFQTVHEFGVLCATTTEGMKKLGYEKISDAYVTLSDHDKLDNVTDMLNDRFGDILKAEKTEESESMTKYKGLIDSLLDIIAYVIYGISVVFAAVVVAMMTKAAFLRERTDLGIYKAVGFTSSDLRMQFAIRFLAVAIIGTIAGLILSFAFTRTAIGFMLRTVGLTDFSAPIKPDIFLIPSVVVCACVFVFAYISSRRIKTVEVRELITE